MGVLKNMYAVSEFEFYSSDYKLFTQILAMRYNVNLEIALNTNDDDTKLELFDFGYSQMYVLEINEHEYKKPWKTENNHYYLYRLKIPVDLQNESQLELEFYPNGICKLNFIPFSNYWSFFINDLLGINDHYYQNHIEIIQNINNIRNCYISIFEKINASKVVIYPDAHYKTEDKYIYTHAYGRITKLSDFINSLNKLDKVICYNFMGVVKQKVNICNMKPIQIAFTDNFTDI
jgi:hypothetical protein